MGLTKDSEEKLKEFSLQLKRGLEEKSSTLLFITGAGVSAESGVPTYRGLGGIYNQGQVEDGYTIEEILSKSVFDHKPELTWKYIHKLEQNCRDKKPNLAHKIIKDFEKYFEVVVLTQNIDSFHQSAGSSNVIPIHGSLNKIICPKCNAKKNDIAYETLAPVPLCSVCTAVLKPDIVLYEENIREENIHKLNLTLNKKLAAVIVIGTSSVFSYIVSPVMHMKAKNKPTLEVNLQPTYLTNVVEVSVAARASESLAFLYQCLTEQIR